MDRMSKVALIRSIKPVGVGKQKYSCFEHTLDEARIAETISITTFNSEIDLIKDTMIV